MFDPVCRAATSRLARRGRAAVSLLVIALLPACVEESTDPIPGNLLVGVKAQNRGVPNISRLVDGELPLEGEPWDSALTARFDNPEGSVTWDLGSEQPVRCALVQGDNNDVYILSGSADGKTWQTLWEAPGVEGAGMRLRQGEVNGKARHLRLTAKDGDHLFSVGEFAAFAECPKGWPKIALNRVEGVAPAGGGEAASSWSVSLGVLVAAAAVLMLLSRKRRPAPPSTSQGSDGDGSSDNDPPSAP